MKKHFPYCLSIDYKYFIFSLLISIILLTASETSMAQCACTPLNETFGSTATCGSPQNTTNSAIVNSALRPYNGGNNDYPDDGEYAIRCNGADVNWGWFGAGGTTMNDHTADAAGQTGNYALINSGAGPREFYHRTVTGLCANTTYNLTYYAGNIVRDNMYGNQPSLETYIFPAGTAVQTCANKTTGGCVPTGGTLLGASGGIASPSSATGFVWNTYSYSFTTGAAQTSIDVVLVSLSGNNAGYDFAFDDVTVTRTSGGGCSLPVKFLSFSAEKLFQNVSLKWSTTSEVNFSYFSVEKSEDGINFSSIGKVEGKGSASEYTDYTFLDAEISGNSCYYRLTAIDLDGKTNYSEIIKIKSRESFLEIYPNPLAKGEELIINFSLSEEASEEQATVSVINSLGAILYSFTRKSNEPFSIHTELSPGIYIIELSSSVEKRFEKLMVAE